MQIGSRTAEPRFDWEDRATWGPALQGVKAAYVAYQPDLAAPGALEIVDAFFRQAIGCGVEKLVLLSGRGEVEAEQAEQALQATGVDWTILRASWFFQNFSEASLSTPSRRATSRCRRARRRSRLSMSTISPRSPSRL